MDICNQIIMKKISEIKPYIRNPRKNDKTVELLVDLIPKVGFNVPIVIDKNGVIVKGHSRFKAGIKLGMKELPCIITNADEEAIKLDRIADNRVSEFSEWLSEPLLHELDTLSIDFSNLEFETPSMAKFDDFPELDDFGSEGESEEEKRAKYEAYIRAQEQQLASQPQFVSQSQINSATEHQAHIGTEQKEKALYYKVVCEKCGHIAYVKAEDVWDANK